jgi:quercetin dioxygenase-like cupin family protein
VVEVPTPSTAVTSTRCVRLDEHENPGEATVYVLHGRVRLAAGDKSWDGPPGHQMIVPDARHTLEGLEDAVVLLTTAMPR